MATRYFTRLRACCGLRYQRSSAKRFPMLQVTTPSRTGYGASVYQMAYRPTLVRCCRSSTSSANPSSTH